MNLKPLNLLFALFILLATSSYSQNKKNKQQPATPQKPELAVLIEPKVLIETDMGNITIKLYNETPLHRDNFLKLVKDTFYNGTLFHRVIQQFMIQGGDPTSRNAEPGKILGDGDIGYTIPAEFNPKFFHKRGALAAARQGDDVNPTKASSGCQFYIVHGKVFQPGDMANIEGRINNQSKQAIFKNLITRPENKPLYEAFQRNQMNKNNDSLQLLSKTAESLVEQELAKMGGPYKFSEEQIKAYTTIGGAPHLDMGYTVFGEVVEGMEVVDKIAAVEKNNVDRPLTDIKMKMKLVEPVATPPAPPTEKK